MCAYIEKEQFPGNRSLNYVGGFLSDSVDCVKSNGRVWHRLVCFLTSTSCNKCPMWPQSKTQDEVIFHSKSSTQNLPLKIFHSTSFSQELLLKIIYLQYSFCNLSLSNHSIPLQIIQSHIESRNIARNRPISYIKI